MGKNLFFFFLWGSLLFFPIGCGENSSDSVKIVEDATNGSPVFTRYRVSFETDWGRPNYPVLFPGNPHFSPLIGATHKIGFPFWKLGGLSSLGMKNMAELGDKTVLGEAIDTEIASGIRGTKISGGGIPISPSLGQLEFTLDSRFPSVSLVSMVAPSPDWFVGVFDLLLFENGVFQEKTIPLFPYDAGTDDGIDFTSDNAPSNPFVGIQKITGVPFYPGTQTLPLGQFKFEIIP